MNIPSSDAFKTSCTIFLVDDEETNLRLLTRVLRNDGYKNLICINDPREVQKHVNQKQPDLVLLDLNMPYLSGFDVLDQLDVTNSLVFPPVVILTAQHGRDILVKALEKGARDYLTKPFEQTELLMRVRNHIVAYLDHVSANSKKEELEHLVNQRTRELRDTRLQVVQKLGRAAEYRDEETGNHILRMSHIAQLIAQKIGWDNYQCELILNASPMHDIGKIGIPDNILQKPGKFDPEEWAIMKTHAEIGARILEGDESDLMIMAREIALNHHEKWDGTGYPNGLTGKHIPESARICAISDVFDALTSVRPYKKAWAIEDAVDLIQKNRDQHFEGRLVDVFIANLPSILEIRARYSDS